MSYVYLCTLFIIHFVPQQQSEEVNGYIMGAGSVSRPDSMSKVLDVIRAVRDGPTPLPSTTIYRLTNQYSNIICGTISDDSSLLLTGCEDSSLIAWDLAPENHKQAQAPGPLDQADPSIIKLGCDDDDENVDKVRDRKKSIFRGHSGPIYDLAFTARSKYLMSVSEDTTMRLWDLSNGVNKAIYQGHSYPIWSVDSDSVGDNLVTGKFPFEITCISLP